MDVWERQGGGSRKGVSASRVRGGLTEKVAPSPRFKDVPVTIVAK